MGTLGFDWGIYSFCDNEDYHVLFECKMLRAQVKSLVERGIIWIEREMVQRDECMVASLYPLATQLKASCNAISVGSRKDWDEYLLKSLGQVAPAPSSSVVIEDIVESPMDLGSSDSEKRQTPLAIEGFTPLVPALLVVIRLALSLVQEGTATFLLFKVSILLFCQGLP